MQINLDTDIAVASVTLLFGGVPLVVWLVRLESRGKQNTDGLDSLKEQHNTVDRKVDALARPESVDRPRGR